MTNKNQVTVTPNCFYGYINEDTACGRAKAKQVKADMETLATILQDTNLSTTTKKAIYTDYAKSIREYVEREETCCGCHNDCECECDCDCEEEYEEEEYEEEECEEVTIEDIVTYAIYVGGSEEIYCDSYADTIEKIELLQQLGLEFSVYGDSDTGESYALDIIDTGKGIDLELAD